MLRNLFTDLFGRCACEPPASWLAGYRDGMLAHGSKTATVDSVNRFWPFRSRCYRFRCDSPETLPASLIALYLPLD